jgi:hypothetical protein
MPPLLPPRDVISYLHFIAFGSENYNWKSFFIAFESVAKGELRAEGGDGIKSRKEEAKRCFSPFFSQKGL